MAARATIDTKLRLDKSAWKAGLREVRSDAKNLARDLPRILGAGTIGGLAARGLSAAQAGAEGIISSAKEAQLAADVTDGRLTKTQLLRLSKDEGIENLSGIVSGGLRGIADIQKRAGQFDEGAIESRARFLGGEGADPYRAMLSAIETHAKAAPSIQGEMERLMPFLANERARTLAPDLIMRAREVDETWARGVDRLNAASKTFDRAVDKIGYITTKAVGVPPGNAGRTWRDAVGSPPDYPYPNTQPVITDEQARNIGREIGKESSKMFER